MPVFIKASPKLSRNPSLYPVRRKYVWSCFLCARVTCSTDLSSRTTFPSTTISARNASSNFMPRNSIEIGTYRSTRSPRCRNSCAKITSYTVSSSPGPNSRWMVTAESTTTFPISFSVIRGSYRGTPLSSRRRNVFTLATFAPLRETSFRSFYRAKTPSTQRKRYLPFALFATFA